ncbi:hypothetical protein G6F66_004033 [Rhizopus arrhizus]|nr:hypothetical protein G6F66_004033 [Rhizopus arrhizus]
MSQFTRPTFNAEDDEDLERLQQEFFSQGQTPAAKVIRKGAPVLKVEAPTMPALEDPTPAMPALEDPTPAMPALEDPTLPELNDPAQDVEYEPVMDPNPEPHVPVSKKMIDLTSMLGQVLGEIQEHTVQKVTAPSLREPKNSKARGQRDGFPKPVHRSEFKKRLEASRQKKNERLEAPPKVQSVSGEWDENEERISQMSEEELKEARAEIMSTLSPESIAILMKGLKKKPDEPIQKTPPTKKPVGKEDDEDDLLKMKEKYFADVPLENDKLAWIDDRFLSVPQEQEKEEEGMASEVEKVYRKVRFDLQGSVCRGEIPVHKGLHHHGDEPEKAGYTLAELFYLMRSQVPSQRALVLTIVARIIERAKRNQDKDEVWQKVLRVFTGKEHAASVYLRSALDDRHLVVLVSAVRALAALVLDEKREERKLYQFMGHLMRPVIRETSQPFERKGLNDKLTELVDRVHQTTRTVEDWKDDATLAEQDLPRALIKMNLLPRLRYLLAAESELRKDEGSMELVMRLLTRLAEAGEDVCEMIEEEELIEPVVSIGMIETSWPMTEVGQRYPSVAAVRLLTTLAQGSKSIAEGLVDKMTSLLALLLTDPEIACEEMKSEAYALQLETLNLLHVLTCYGFIVPILETLQDPVMDWLRNVRTRQERTRACAAVGLLEVLLHAAADPHKTVPEHAIDWHQPTAYLPAILALLKDEEVFEASLGYLATWASYIDLFSPAKETVEQVWKAVIIQESSFNSRPSAASVGYTTHHVLRYIQFISAYATLHHACYQTFAKEAMDCLVEAEGYVKGSYKKDLFGRYALWIWLKHRKEVDMLWSIAELETGMKCLHMGITETWLSQDFLQLCLSKQVVDEKMRPFYFQLNSTELEISKALFRYDGRGVKTFMYPQSTSELSDVSAFIMSPIDALYHLDKSRVAQQVQEDAATVVVKTFETADRLLEIEHAMAIISLMKVFLIGDREGRSVDMESDKEIFWDPVVQSHLDDWLKRVCKKRTNLDTLEAAWRRSSVFIRQTHLPFFQFFQSFVAHYASVSLGHHGFARLLVYLVTQIDVVDYRHLVLSDYHDILSTLKVGLNEVPQLDKKELEQLSKGGLVLL